MALVVQEGKLHTASTDGTISIRDVEAVEEAQIIQSSHKLPDGQICSLIASDSGLIATRFNGVVQVISNGSVIKSLQFGHAKAIISAESSSDCFKTKSYDNQVIHWKLTNEHHLEASQCICQFHSNSITHKQAQSAQGVIATADDKHSIHLNTSKVNFVRQQK